VDDALNRATFTNAPQPFLEKGQIFHVAIEHRLMHAETLTYMFHWLDFHLKRELPASQRRAGAKRRGGRSQATVTIPSGNAVLGQTSNGPTSFGWDNEFQSHSVLVPQFSIDAFNVTHEDFLQFVRAGGYEERSLWTDEAWSWLQLSGIRHPKFWIPRADAWFCRTMFEEIPLPPSWPVYVSHAEALAYARWKGKSLPTEAQYHRAAFGFPDGAEPVSAAEGNFNFESWTPTPVGSFAPSAFGIFDLLGNGWEWTNTLFAPFDGFEPFPFYRGYSANFFDGKHFVLKGASPQTASSLVRRSFRNWFQSYYPNVYATFRCVEN
jgi:iron(II)-dependent oxidoreductase